MQYTIFPHQDAGCQIGIGLSDADSCITERDFIFHKGIQHFMAETDLFFPYMKPGFREKLPKDLFHFAMCPFLIFIFITHYFSLPESLSYRTLTDGSGRFRCILFLFLHFLYGSIRSCHHPSDIRPGNIPCPYFLRSFPYLLGQMPFTEFRINHHGFWQFCS